MDLEARGYLMRHYYFAIWCFFLTTQVFAQIENPPKQCLNNGSLKEKEFFERLNRNPIEGDASYEVKFLYIVPKDRVEREDFQPILETLAQRLKQFFDVHLGKPFNYADPLFEVVKSNLSEVDIKGGHWNSWRYANDNGSPIIDLNVFQHLVDLVDRHYYADRYQRKVLFISIMEVDAWVARGGAGFASFGGKELTQFHNLWSLGYLYPFDHVLGHALGLPHSQDLYDCAKKLDSSIQYEYSFMSHPPRQFPANQPMSSSEKTILSKNHISAKQCLARKGQRPHPSLYFGFQQCPKSPDINNDGRVNMLDLSTVINAWGSCSDLENCPADLTCDGHIDMNDLSLILNNWG